MTETPDTPADPDQPQADFDSPWKEAIDAFFRPFMALFFPAVYDLIDWTRPHEFLDAELQRITGDSTIGRRYADRLVRVWSLEGLEVWLFLHIEVQGRADAGFPRRMFQYWYRIYDRHGEVPILSLAVLTDDRGDGDYGEYRQERLGLGLQFRFGVQSLPAWDEAVLVARAADNPFAVVALAQRAAHRRASDPERKARKGELIALLYRYRYSREDAIRLLRFIDWLIRLPRPLELALRQELEQLEEQTKMSYVTSWERFAREEGFEQGIEKGRQEGRQEGLQAGLRTGLQTGLETGRQEGEQAGEVKSLLRLLAARFGEPTAAVRARVQTADSAQLERWLPRILAAQTIDEVLEGN